MLKFAIVMSALVAVVLTAPVDETVLIDEIARIDEIALVDETTPVDETTRVVTTTPVDETTRVVTTTPVDETTRVEATTPIPILWERNQGPNADGSYWWSYETANGISAEEKGTPKLIGTGDYAKIIIVVEGRYSYTDKDGTVIETIYVADENGFRAMGAHIPSPHPMP